MTDFDRGALKVPEARQRGRIRPFGTGNRSAFHGGSLQRAQLRFTCLGLTLVPLESLGRRVDMVEGPVGVFDPMPARGGAGGPALKACRLTPALFEAASMVRVARDLMKMTVLELKDELQARGATKSGALKSVLRGRLRAIIVAAHGKGGAASGSAAAAGPSATARKRPRESGERE